MITMTGKVLNPNTESNKVKAFKRKYQATNLD